MARFQCNLISYVLQRTVDITVVVPSATIPESMAMGETKPTHVITEKYPVLYLLHGYGNNHATWCGYTNIELYAEEHRMAVVMLSGENKFYRDVPGGDKYFDFISQELPEFVTNYFPISAEPEHTYIAGLSMGGYGALLHGLTYPERFAAIGSFSGAVMPATNPDGTAADSSLDITCLARSVMADGGKLPPMYIACGEKDFLFEANEAFKDMLMENKQDVTWATLPEFGHEWRFWDIQVEQFLKWIPRTDGYAAGGLRQI